MKPFAQNHDFEERRQRFCVYPRSLIGSGWLHHPDPIKEPHGLRSEEAVSGAAVVQQTKANRGFARMMKPLAQNHDFGIKAAEVLRLSKEPHGLRSEEAVPGAAVVQQAKANRGFARMMKPFAQNHDLGIKAAEVLLLSKEPHGLRAEEAVPGAAVVQQTKANRGFARMMKPFVQNHDLGIKAAETLLLSKVLDWVRMASSSGPNQGAPRSSSRGSGFRSGSS